MKAVEIPLPSAMLCKERGPDPASFSAVPARLMIDALVAEDALQSGQGFCRVPAERREFSTIQLRHCYTAWPNQTPAGHTGHAARFEVLSFAGSEPRLLCYRA